MTRIYLTDHRSLSDAQSEAVNLGCTKHAVGITKFACLDDLVTTIDNDASPIILFIHAQDIVPKDLAAKFAAASITHYVVFYYSTSPGGDVRLHGVDPPASKRFYSRRLGCSYVRNITELQLSHIHTSALQGVAELASETDNNNELLSRYLILSAKHGGYENVAKKIQTSDWKDDFAKTDLLALNSKFKSS